MGLSIQSVVSSYTYSYHNTLRPKLDKNDDAKWSKTEIQSYARDYTKATGEKLDADKVMADYDKDVDGVLSKLEQDEVISNDALRLDNLSRLRVIEMNANGATSLGSVADSDTESSGSLDELISSMPASKKYSLVSSMYKAEQNGSIMTAFQNAGTAALDMYSLISQQTSAKMYSAFARYGGNSDQVGSLLNMLA